MSPREIVEFVLKEARGRGADNWWEDIDEDTQAEIVYDITYLLEGELCRVSDQFGRLMLPTPSE